ncbi:hypothetical protein [Synechococcus sp. PCC 7336]|nr:hypothetical protein [Synechococcus sp. PCC 7336]
MRSWVELLVYCATERRSPLNQIHQLSTSSVWQSFEVTAIWPN